MNAKARGARFPRWQTGRLASGVIAAAAMAALSACTSSEFIPRDDSGFRYLDYKGSPYDQTRTPYPGINQIQCPPPSRPICGG